MPIMTISPLLHSPSVQLAQVHESHSGFHKSSLSSFMSLMFLCIAPALLLSDNTCFDYSFAHFPQSYLYNFFDAALLHGMLYPTNKYGC